MPGVAAFVTDFLIHLNSIVIDVRIFYKPLIRTNYHHINVLNNYSKQLYLICPTQSPIYVVSTPHNGSYSIKRVHLDYFHITTLISKLLTTPIVQCH